MQNLTVTAGNPALTSDFSRMKRVQGARVPLRVCGAGGVVVLHSFAPYLLSLRSQYKRITNSQIPHTPNPFGPHLIQSQHCYKEAARQGVPVPKVK